MMEVSRVRQKCEKVAELKSGKIDGWMKKKRRLNPVNEADKESAKPVEVGGRR